MQAPSPDIPAIQIEFDSTRLAGRLTLMGEPTSGIWERIRSITFSNLDSREISENRFELPWHLVLNLLRDFGSRQQQQLLGFRFRPIGEAAVLAAQFAKETVRARQVRLEIQPSLTTSEIVQKLQNLGFSKRELREFQQRDVQHLLALPHGANFSVPGAGKTTVTLALHVLTQTAGVFFFVVGPKASFPAWRNVIAECVVDTASTVVREPFRLLDGSEYQNDQALRSGSSRFLMSYDLMVRQQSMLAAFFARQPTHLVLDEAHRMKAGMDSQRGAFLLNVAPLLARRDILTGTPMPQGPGDLSSQLNFLWPGQGLDSRLTAGEPPREVLGQLYVRTTKAELGLPKAKRHFINVKMRPGQQALYGLVRSEVLRRLSETIRGKPDQIDYVGAKRSVIRLLQLSVNPILALRGITEDIAGVESGVVDAVMQEGTSAKIEAVCQHARELAARGRKVVVWTIFTGNILELESQLADLNPVSIFGAVPSGDENDPSTREGRLRKFHSDSTCMVFIGNPAAAGEGISLHMAAHDAIYLDRSYVSTHYLQSIDRIHRLGLPEDVETNIFIYRTQSPVGLGSIDYSVSRRLAKKIRNLQELLDDTDLHEIAFDEEDADDPIDYEVDLQDLVDLIEEMEGKSGPDEAGEAED